MKILFILDLYKPHIGWGEILFENVITRLSAQGHNIVVLTSRFSPNIPEYERISDTVEIYRVGHNRYDFMFYALFLGVKLAKQCDIIHTATYNAAIPSSIIGQIAGKKVVLTVHEIFGKLWYRFMGWKGFFFKLFESCIFLFPFDRYFCISHYTKNSLRVAMGLPDNKLRTIHLGIDYDLWARKNFTRHEEVRKELGWDTHFLGLFFGRPGVSKWLEYFVRSIPGIVSNIPNFRAILLVSESSNNPLTHIRSFIRELDIENYVTFVKPVPYTELGNYILASDFVVIPSLVEGFWFAAAETCALEKEIIVTNAASLPEVVSGKVSFVEPSNSSDIVRAATEIHSWQYEVITGKEFLWSKHIEKILLNYEEVLWG